MALKLRNFLLFLIAFFALFFLAGCVNIDPPIGDEQAWVSYVPVQCGGNPWEMWYASGGINYLAEPTEGQLVQDYYTTQQGIEILEVIIIPPVPGTDVCAACSCPRGDSIDVRIYSKDSAKMLELGWT